MLLILCSKDSWKKSDAIAEKGLVTLAGGGDFSRYFKANFEKTLSISLLSKAA